MQLVFEGIRGNGFKGDIGLDDIAIVDGPCGGIYIYISLFAYKININLHLETVLKYIFHI